MNYRYELVPLSDETDFRLQLIEVVESLFGENSDRLPERERELLHYHMDQKHVQTHDRTDVKVLLAKYDVFWVEDVPYLMTKVNNDDEVDLKKLVKDFRRVLAKYLGVGALVVALLFLVNSRLDNDRAFNTGPAATQE